MAHISIVREVPLSPREAWERVTDFERHGRLVPLTSVQSIPDGILARTDLRAIGLGRIGFDDPMRIVEWDAPRRCRLNKYGRVLIGHAEIVVSPSTLGSRVVWDEEVHLRGLPRWFAPLERWAAGQLFGRLLDRLLN